MRQAEKVERLRLREPAASSIRRSKPPQRDQPCLTAVQLQAETREPHAQIGPEPLGIVTMLKAHHEVIREPHHDHVTARAENATGGPTGLSEARAVKPFWLLGFHVVDMSSTLRLQPPGPTR